MVRHNQDIKNVAMENGFYDLDLHNITRKKERQNNA